MTQVAVITVEGVLSHSDDIRQVPATKWAKPLYDALRTQYNTVALTCADDEIAQWWLKRERFHGWSRVLSWPRERSAFTYPRWRIDEVQAMLADGFEVGLYLDTDLQVLEQVHQMGVMTLAMSYPSKAVGWRDPDTSAPRPWAEVASTVEGIQEVEHGTR